MELSEVQGPWESLISLEEVRVIHSDSIKHYGGGLNGESNFGDAQAECIRGELGNAWTTAMYMVEAQESDDVELEPGYDVFACAAFFYTIKRHCLADGNKRVAWMILNLVLAKLGMAIDEQDEAAEEFCVDCVCGKISDVYGVCSWVNSRTIFV